MSFESFYWRVAGLSLADRDELAQLEDERLSIEQRKATLIRMLHSASVALRGIALDFYCLANANLRHGPEPMIDDAVEDAVRASALGELERPPYESTGSTARPRRGANHASALAALANNADPADASVLARVLRENDEESVLHEGVRAAHSVLRGEPAHPELMSILLDIARRAGLDATIRANAITAIGSSGDDAVIPWLIEALGNPEVAVSAAAARGLLERDFKRHRALVEPVAAAWRTGEFPPFDVHEVRRLLDEEFLEVAGVRIPLTDAFAGLQLDPARPFEALSWVVNAWIHGEFPGLLERLECGADAVAPAGQVTRPAQGDITEERVARWRDTTGTELGDDPVLVTSEMTTRSLLLPRHVVVELLHAIAQLRAAAAMRPRLPLEPGSSQEDAPEPAGLFMQMATDQPARQLERAGLYELEDLAVAVDTEASATTVDERGDVAAMRRRLLDGLEAHGVLDEGRAAEKRAILEGWRLPRLRDYVDAATALRAYYRSDVREAQGLERAPARLLEGAVSLDWFRLPGPRPSGVRSDTWLASAELVLRESAPSGAAGRIRSSIRDGMYEILWRRDYDRPAVIAVHESQP